jgi:hypothetical protein
VEPTNQLATNKISFSTPHFTRRGVENKNLHGVENKIGVDS